MPRFEGAGERADQLEAVLGPSISANAFPHDAPPAARRIAVAVCRTAKKSPEWEITVFPADPAIRRGCLSATLISLPILGDKSLLVARFICTVIPAQSGVSGQSNSDSRRRQLPLRRNPGASQYLTNTEENYVNSLEVEH